MPKIGDTVQGLRAAAAGPGAAALQALAWLGGAIGGLVPRRLLRLAEKIEGRRNVRTGHFAAAAFLVAFVVYGLIGGGHVRRMTEAALIAAGFWVERIEISGHVETAELAILEQLELDGSRSLVTYDVAAARARLASLPWVATATVRKHYPDRLLVAVKERVPFALWQRNHTISLIDRTGKAIAPYEDPRFANLPLVVGRGANAEAEAFLSLLEGFPDIAERLRATVLVAERRWNMVFENGITVKLPETNVGEALEQLAVLDAVDGLLSRDVTIVDLRLSDRVTVRLPDDTAETTRARGASEVRRLRESGART